MAERPRDTALRLGVSWPTGWAGAESWHARGRFLCWGQQIVKVCATKTGARIRARRRQRADDAAWAKHGRAIA